MTHAAHDIVTANPPSVIVPGGKMAKVVLGRTWNRLARKRMPIPGKKALPVPLNSPHGFKKSGCRQQDIGLNITHKQVPGLRKDNHRMEEAVILNNQSRFHLPNASWVEVLPLHPIKPGA